jgi:hypothetical protein
MRDRNGAAMTAHQYQPEALTELLNELLKFDRHSLVRDQLRVVDDQNDWG